MVAEGSHHDDLSQFEEGKYEDAIASANRYVSLYPSSPETPYAMYLAGMSYYNQIPDVARDQERAEKALAYFNQIVEKYPQSEYATDAKFKMQVARDHLAGKEMTVGRFYMQRRNWTAAINRFREVLGQIQMTRHTEEALYRSPTEADSRSASLARRRPPPPCSATTTPTCSSGIRTRSRGCRPAGCRPKSTPICGFRRPSRGVGLG